MINSNKINKFSAMRSLVGISEGSLQSLYLENIKIYLSREYISNLFTRRAKKINFMPFVMFISQKA